MAMGRWVVEATTALAYPAEAATTLEGLTACSIIHEKKNLPIWANIHADGCASGNELSRADKLLSRLWLQCRSLAARGHEPRNNGRPTRRSSKTGAQKVHPARIVSVDRSWCFQTQI